MYYGDILIEEYSVGKFMNEVKPQSAFRVEKEESYWMFEFTTEEDFTKAQAWDYANCPRYFAPNGSDYIYYDTNTNSYSFSKAGKVVTGFDNPDAAEEAFWNIEE